MKYPLSKELEKKRLNYKIFQNETIVCIRLRRKVCSQQIFEIVQRLNCYVFLAKKFTHLHAWHQKQCIKT